MSLKLRTVGLLKLYLIVREIVRVIEIKFFLFAGELDHLPEVAFYMVGNIDEVVAKAEKIAREH